MESNIAATVSESFEADEEANDEECIGRQCDGKNNNNLAECKVGAIVSERFETNEEAKNENDIAGSECDGKNEKKFTVRECDGKNKKNLTESNTATIVSDTSEVEEEAKKEKKITVNRRKCDSNMIEYKKKKTKKSNSKKKRIQVFLKKKRFIFHLNLFKLHFFQPLKRGKRGSNTKYSEKKKELDLDCWSEVLCRLPIKFSIMLKPVSRGWNHIISELAFLKVRCKKREPVSGFLIQGKTEAAVFYIPVEKQHSEFYQLMFNFLGENPLDLVASCHGLVCWRSHDSTPWRFRPDSTIYICNPLNKEKRRINVDMSNEQSLAMAFDPYQDSKGDLKLIKVNKDFSFAIYSFKTALWKNAGKSYNYKSIHLYKDPVFVNGLLYWLTNNYELDWLSRKHEILSIDVENEISWMTSDPTGGFDTIDRGVCIGDSDEKLNYILVSEFGLEVWAIEANKWSLKIHKTQTEIDDAVLASLGQTMEDRYPDHDIDIWMQFVDPLAYKDGWLLMRMFLDIFVYNLETDELRYITNFSDLPGLLFEFTVVPYSLTLIHLNQA